ncbi:putative uncharacterized protein [Clostridium sp. CAG:75]|nr:putative uncharacterized protein [Clostridium sp. CAG:75]
MQQLYANYSLLMIMLGAGIITLLLQSIAGHVMNDLLEECSKIAGTKNPWIRNLIKKFQVCYELHIPAKDVGGFVDRYLLEYRAYQIRLSTWENVGLYGAWFVGMYFGVCTIYGIYIQTSLQVYGMYCIYTVIILALIFGGELLMQVHAHKKMIRIYLLDYLENSLQPRLENQYLYPEEQAKYQQAYFEEPEQQTLALAAGNEETEQEKEAVWSIAGRWQDGMEYAVHEEWQNEHGHACKQTLAPTWPEGDMCKQTSAPAWLEKGIRGQKEQRAEEKLTLLGEIMEEYF